jgi:hypothetical protein
MFRPFRHLSMKTHLPFGLGTLTKTFIHIWRNMIIRNEQVSVFRELQVKPIVDEIARRLRSRYAEETGSITAEMLERQIRLGLTAAEAHRIVSKADIARFVEILYAFSPEMKVEALGETNKHYLENYRFSPEERLDLITLQIAFDTDSIAEPPPTERRYNYAR